MRPAEFLALIQRGAREDIIRDALATNPGLVYELWYPWREHSLHDSIHRDTWVWLFQTAGYTSNYRRAEPPDSILLARGASDDRRLGMSWTTNYNQAIKFATEVGGGVWGDRRYAGNTYTHWATADEILAHYIRWEGEKKWDEYVLDYRRLNDSNVHLCDVSNYSQMYAKCIIEGRPTDFGIIL